MISTYFNTHSHTYYSNVRLLDCINNPKALIDKARELGLSGIAITDHEVLSAHVEVNQLMQEYQSLYPNFTIALGNEIYLVEERKTKQKYFHFVLIAKDAIGHKALRELSSTAWFHSYPDRGQERVPTLKKDLAEIVHKYPNHLIATTACMGGELSSLLAQYYKLKNNHANAAELVDILTQINSFIGFCKDLFADDFYIECAPSAFKDQIAINKGLKQIALEYNLPLVVGTDAHYLTVNERYAHKVYLTSKEGEREIEGFYDYARLMEPKEVRELLYLSNFSDTEIDNIFLNSELLRLKLTNYCLFHKQDIPSVEVADYPKDEVTSHLFQNRNFTHLANMLISDDVQDRYWVNECLNKITELNKSNSHQYYMELEEEARVKSIIGAKLETNMFRYPNTLQHYIDLIWECGSMVGAGRGSSCAALNHYLMGITQLDPIEWDLPFFRYLNEERVELGDIDIDICPSKRPIILEAIKQERAHLLSNTDGCLNWAKDNLGCTLIATFGTEGTKSAILTAGRGYRSKEFPSGLDVEDTQYMSSLIPQERGFLWPIQDVVFGNTKKNRSPISQFVNTVQQYKGLLDIILSLDGLLSHRGSHASGVILFNDDPFEHCAFMKTPKGEIITQFDLHQVEYLGNVKYDFLVTDVQDKIVQTIQLLQADGLIDKQMSLREIYNKYLHPNVLPLQNKHLWTALENNEVLNCFQFDSPVGAQAAKMIKPQNVLEMSDANGLMRLMGEDGDRPLEKYVRFKNNINLWYEEMTNFGLTLQEQKSLEPYFKQSYGVPPSQEQLMRMLMDENICGFTLAEANNARKIVGKKQMNKIPDLKDKVLRQASSPTLGEYVWKYGAGPQMGYSFSVVENCRDKIAELSGKAKSKRYANPNRRLAKALVRGNAQRVKPVFI